MVAALAAGLATACWYGASAQGASRSATGCGGETFAEGTAGRILDGRTFVLDNGREIRLAGIEVPPLAQPQGQGPAPDGSAARDALAALLSSVPIVLKQADAQKTDRYGRLVAYAFVKRDGADHAVQADLVAAGQARVAARGKPRLRARAVARGNRGAKGQAWPLGKFVL